MTIHFYNNKKQIGKKIGKIMKDRNGDKK